LEERTSISRPSAALAVTELRWSLAPTRAEQSDEDQHRVAARVVVDVVPVRVTGVVDAVLAAAVAGVGQTDAGRPVRRRERESSPIRKECLNLSRGQPGSQAVGGCRFDESAW